jgi:hypothetical protein
MTNLAPATNAGAFYCGHFSNSGSFAILAAIHRASSRVSLLSGAIAPIRASAVGLSGGFVAGA